MRDLFELGRISNLPTCLSNCTVGYLLGGGDLATAWSQWLASCFAVICFYEAGMVFNDFFDREIDSRERPERPIPSGRVSPAQAQYLGLVLTGVGWITVLTFFPQGWFFAALLVIFILIYDRWHGISDASALLMGSCRGLIYLLGACAAGWNPSFTPWLKFPFEMMMYVSALTWLAQSEVGPSPFFTRKFAPFLSGLILFVDFASWTQGGLLAKFSLSVALAWTFLVGSRLVMGEISVKQSVGNLLAAISLWDGAILALCSNRFGVGIAWLCFWVTQKGHRKIQGS